MHLHSDDHDHDENDEKRKEWRLDIFMTNAELPFAGHPTVGAAWYVMNVLLPRTQMSAALVTKSGRIEIERIDDGVRAKVASDVHIHDAGQANDMYEDDAQWMSTVPELRQREKIASRLVSIVKGMNFLCCDVESLEVLALARNDGRYIHPTTSRLLDHGWQEGFVGKSYFVITGVEDGGNHGKVVSLRTRMMEGLFEDPATGSAACALGCYLALDESRGFGDVVRFDVVQGVEIGRRSVIGVDVVVGMMDGKRVIESVKLSGQAVKVMEGKLFI